MKFSTIRERKSFTLVKSEERKNMSATQRRWSVAFDRSDKVAARRGTFVTQARCCAVEIQLAGNLFIFTDF